MTQVTSGLTGALGHGRGFSEPLSVADPAVGGGFTITIGSQYWERLASLAFRLVTDSNAANRQVTLTVNGGDGIPLAAFPAASVQTASLTWDYFFLPNLTNFQTVVNKVVTSPAPRLFLQPMYSLVVSIGAVQVGDQVSRIRFYRERFVTGPQGYEQGRVADLEGARLGVARLAEFLG